MGVFNWLHLTDLHIGMSGEKHLWPNVRATFFDDLAKLHEKCGPWHAVLFTGDLTQKGEAAEFKRLDRDVFDPLWEHLKSLGSDPVLLAVPGNHDLQRPKPSPAVRLLLKWTDNPEIHEEFWEQQTSDYRQVITTAFANYGDWWRKCSYRGSVEIQDGLLPGDFSATVENRDGLSIGVAGLNTTFLQLAGGDFTGRLAWDVRQFHAARGGDGAEWVKQHDACILLTHQGPDWLNEPSRAKVYPEINPAGRFAVHLFGHMHENVIRSQSHGGGPMVRHWQRPSLFGLERYGEKEEDRRHGYAAGRIEFKKNGADIRHWPKKAIGDANGWRFIRDEERCVLEDDGGTHPEQLSIPPQRLKPKSGASTKPRPRNPDNALARQRALEIYLEATRQFCDIIDLAGLPEDDRHLAMQKFLLRQLYVPLRVSVEAPAQAGLSEREIENLEQRRERQRLSAAGRIAREDSARQIETQPVGKRLWESKRLVVLGDPGGGKTTLLRWLATACLLRQANDADFTQLPDADTLPQQDWIPVLIRCRELEHQRLKQYTLDDILRQALSQLHLPGEQSAHLTSAIHDLLGKGKAMLLVDGLDEITDPTIRAAFCRQIEKIAGRYASAPIIATSRIVGYREMRFRLGKGFEHCTLADLTPEDKDAFVRRWCEVVEKLPERRTAEAEKLISSIHSSDRIERLTGNPMLLTTMALVQRKVGKLPSRRHKLYEEAVGVLLNWRSDVDRPLDADEALPQLQYVAYAMCQRGVQRLRRDELLELLEGVRRDYPHIRPIQRQTPEEFLAQLERRTSLIVEVGEAKHDGRMVPVYEFRHLTFQEYLAGLALVEGRFPGHDRASTLAQRIAPLAGQTEEKANVRGDSEREVTENWREVLRLCIACCNDDDVDDALLAIVTPAPSEDAAQTARPRAILAALCLADEPNVSAATAEEVIRRFTEQVREGDGRGHVSTGADRAALELAASDWGRSLQAALVREFMSRGPETRSIFGGLSSMVSEQAMPSDSDVVARWMTERIAHISSETEEEAIEAALAVMQVSYKERAIMVPGLVESLLGMLSRSPVSSHAAIWALGWLQKDSEGKRIWQPTDAELICLVKFLEDPANDPEALYWLVGICKDVKPPGTVDLFITMLRHPYARVRQAVVKPLGQLADARAVEPLIECLKDKAADSGFRSSVADALGQLADPRAVELVLNDEDSSIRRAGFAGLARIRGDETDKNLLSRDLEGLYSWLDPASPIDEAHVEKAAARLKLSEEEVRLRYEALAKEFHLRLAWQTGQ